MRTGRHSAPRCQTGAGAMGVILAMFSILSVVLAAPPGDLEVLVVKTKPLDSIFHLTSFLYLDAVHKKHETDDLPQMLTAPLSHTASKMDHTHSKARV